MRTAITSICSAASCSTSPFSATPGRTTAGSPMFPWLVRTSHPASAQTSGRSSSPSPKSPASPSPLRSLSPSSNYAPRECRSTASRSSCGDRRSLRSWSSSPCPPSCSQVPCCCSTGREERSSSTPLLAGTFFSTSTCSGGLDTLRFTSFSFRAQPSCPPSWPPSAAATFSDISSWYSPSYRLDFWRSGSGCITCSLPAFRRLPRATSPPPA